MRLLRPPWQRQHALALVCLLIACLGLLYWLTRDNVPVSAPSLGPSRALVSPGDYRLEGEFSSQPVRHGVWEPDDAGSPQFGLTSGTPSNQGHAASGTFEAPRVLTLYFDGFLSMPGVAAYLQDIATNEKLLLRSRADAGVMWTRAYWQLPPRWRDRTVRLVADDRSVEAAGWLGITLPEEGGPPLLFSLRVAVTLLLVLLFHALLLFLPGIAVAGVVGRRVRLSGLSLACTVILGSLAVGYLCFWMSFWNVTAGKVLTAISVLSGCSVLVIAARNGELWIRKRVLDTLAAFVLTFLTAAIYWNAALLFGSTGPDAQFVETTTVPQRLPPDNWLPLHLAADIWHETPIRPFLGEWKSSDRPPLQAGAALLQYPFWIVFGESRHYQAVGMLLQALWAGAIWLLLRAAKVRIRAIHLTLSLCLTAFFFYVHTYYVWPKLLPAALLLIALSRFPFLTGASAGWTRLNVVLASVAIGLSMLAHTGSSFTLFGAAVVALLWKGLPPWRLFVLAAGILVILLVPWILYQKLYDPPGDGLIKLHLGGAASTDPRPLPKVLRDAYSSLTLERWLAGRWQNVRQIIGTAPASGPAASFLTAAAEKNFFQVLPSLGLLNLGFLALIPLTFRQTYRRDIRFIGICGAISAVSMFFWCLVMLRPASTVIHQGSLADTALLFLSGSLGLALFSEALARMVIAIQGFWFLPGFVLSSRLANVRPGEVLEGTLNYGMVFVLLILVVAWMLWWRRAEALLLETASPAEKRPI